MFSVPKLFSALACLSFLPFCSVALGLAVNLPTVTSSLSASSDPISLDVASILSSSSPQKSQSSSDLDTIRARRLSLIAGGVTSVSSISKWSSSLGSDGKWSDVDYTAGCDGRPANWPAASHWQRITTMAAAYHGGVNNADQWVNSSSLRSSISSAMNYWFSNDFVDSACLYQGNSDKCPCGTAGLWNSNWFSNVILIPTLVGETCLLLSNTTVPLTSTQLSNCTHMTTRAFNTVTSGQSFVSGANILDIAKVGIDQGLRANNASLVTDAFTKIHAEVVIHDTVSSDGIRRDGSFGQHLGILYNGNYGKDYANDDLGIELEAGGTQFAATEASKEAFATLVDGDQWMIYRNVLTGVLHWDFSALGRFISFPVIDSQATASININLTQLLQLGQEWGSSTLTSVYHSLSQSTTDANAGKLNGTRMFYNNDYMVQRGPGYVTTLKMFSTRTKNTECTNSQNTLGFHLADGALYTYVQGNEYEDIAAAWDWNLIPGITVDYDNTPLRCASTGFTGKEDFVGGTTDGLVGASAMRYTNPDTGDLSWQKAWFFLEGNVQRVMIAGINSTSSKPVYSVLDQKRHDGTVYVNGSPMNQDNYTGATSLWHGNVGYTFNASLSSVYELSVEVGNRTGDWSTIGVSSQPAETVDLFAAWLTHRSVDTPIEYTAFPAADFSTFKSKISSVGLHTLQNDEHISAIYDETRNTAMVVFWDASGGSLQFVSSSGASTTIQTDGNSVLIYNMNTGNVTVSDASQKLTSLHVTTTKGKLTFILPSGGSAGSSVSQTL